MIPVTFVFLLDRPPWRTWVPIRWGVGMGMNPMNMGAMNPMNMGAMNPMNMAGYGGCGSLPDDVAASGCWNERLAPNPMVHHGSGAPFQTRPKRVIVLWYYEATGVKVICSHDFHIGWIFFDGF